MQEKISRRRAGHASNVDANLLSLSSQIPGTGVRYISTAVFPHLDRVIAQPALQDRLEDATIGEEYVWNQSERKHIRSENLATPSSNSQAVPVRSSTIWTSFNIPTIGNPENAVPRTPSGGNSVASDDQRKSGKPSAAAEPSKFLPIQDQARLREWSRNVDTAADPAVPADQPMEPIEEEGEPTSRRVVKDSDSEVEQGQGSEPVNARLVAVDSDEEDEVPRQAPTASTRMPPPQPVISAAPDSEDKARRARERANRYQDTAPVAPTSQGRQPATNVVGADSFFVGVPRDEDEPAEAVQSRRIVTSRTQNDSQQSRPTEPKRARGRGFGYDGAGDDPDESDPGIANDDVSRLTPMSYRDPEPHHYMPSDDFNPSRYGASRVQGRQKRGPTTGTTSPATIQAGPGRQQRNDHFPRRFPSQQAGPLDPDTHSRPVDSWPRPGIARDIDHRSRREAERTKHRQQANQLIDVEDNSTKTNSLLPPPGLTIRQPDAADPAVPDHILDSPLEQIQRPSLKPSWDAPMYTNEDTSFSASSSSGGARQLPFNYTPQTQLVRPNINMMHNDTLAQLQTIKYLQRKKSSRPDVSAHASERIEEEDEVESRKFHNTMNLKAPNPGKGKKSSKAPAQESAAQRAERIAATMADAYGAVPNSVPATTTTALPSRGRPEVPSRRLQQLARSNPTMAATHSDTLQSNARRELTDNLVHRMRPVFEAARSFAGDLQFEIQVGNLLVMASSLIKEKKVYEPDRWTTIFNSTGIAPEVKFNNVVTSDGSDIDNILEMKARGNKALKAWNKTTPGPLSMEFEFQCQDNAGRAFNLRFNVDGTHSVDEGYCTVGKVGIQCPGRTWDVCAVLGGLSTWHYLSDDLEAAVAELVSSIHVNPVEAMTINFRLPASNALTVHDVVVRRTSLHDCQSTEQEEIQLKITESKLLYTRSHRVDKRLYSSFEKSHGNMAENHRVHYELSLVHKGIAEAFKANKQLEVGELTPADTTGASLLNAKVANTLLNAALNLVDKIDWVGKRNYGTIVRKRDELIARGQELARTLPPVTNTNIVRPVNLNSGHSIAAPRTAIASRTNVGSRYPAPAPPAMPVRGIRAGTEAQVYEDASGNLFRIGLGGAQIPVIREDGSGVGSAEILPNDSASQIGSRPRVARSTRYDDRPAGFW